jgi:hypothetical protein
MLLSAVWFDMDGDVSRLKTLLQQTFYRIRDFMSFRRGKGRVDGDNHIDRWAMASVSEPMCLP